MPFVAVPPETFSPPARIVETLLAPPASIPESAFPTIQVNTIDGMNVLGDAANEPSIAVNPLAPNNIVVGWRQFDTIASNFREMGYSWSRDGGRTWSGIHVNDPGVFRTDPVLLAERDGTFFW